MSFRNSVTIVASPRPRVGKTLVARLITDFHRHEGRPVVAFDVNSGEDTLVQFLPAQTSAASIADIRGQMALFDRLIADDGVSKVVDLGAESFTAFFALAGKIGFVEEARRRAVAPTVLFVMTPDRTAVEAYRHLYERFPALTLTPVHNEILGPARHRDKYLFVGGATVELRLPLLTRSLRQAIETPPFSLADLLRGGESEVAPDTRADLQSWVRRVFLEFRERELRILLADLRSSFKFGSQ
jgi:hypothetical protein